MTGQPEGALDSRVSIRERRMGKLGDPRQDRLDWEEEVRQAEALLDRARSRMVLAAVSFCDGAISAGQLRAFRELLREQEKTLQALHENPVAPFVEDEAPAPAAVSIPSIPTPKAGEWEDLPDLPRDVSPELREMLASLDSKIERLDEDLQQGRINASQYRAIRRHYLDQRDVAVRLQRSHPESDRWRVVLEEGKTSFLLQLNEAVLRSFTLYDLRTRARIYNQGNLPSAAEEAVRLLGTFGPDGPQSKPGRMLGMQSDDGSAYLLIPGNYTAALVVFTQDPPAWQLRAMREVHANFEAANRPTLERGERQTLIFPDLSRFIRD
jgi:hypothetical protein